MPRPRRRSNYRPAKPVWVVACEDAVSVPDYFRALGRIFNDVVSIKLESKRSHKTAPEQVVEAAKKIFDGLEPGTESDRAWAIFDAEPQCGVVRKEEIDRALDNARKHNIEVLISNPCFEHWMRLHLHDCDGGFGSSREAFKAFKEDWQCAFRQEYKKGKTDLSGLITRERLDSAATRAEVQHKRKCFARAHRCAPCVTELYKFIGELKRLKEECRV